MAKRSKPVAKSNKSGSADNSVVCAILSYFIVGIIWYFADDAMRKSGFAKFHAKQGLVLLLSWIIVSVVGALIFWIPIIGWLISFVVWVCFVVIWIIGIINAATGHEKSLPIIGSFADKISF